MYLRDSGLLHVLLDIETFDDLMGHPVNGASWEGFVVENLIAANPRWHPTYIRTGNDAEVDLVLTRGQRRVLIECKLSKAPAPSRSFHRLKEDLEPDAAWIVAPVDAPYAYQQGVRIGNLPHIHVEDWRTTTGRKADNPMQEIMSDKNQFCRL